MDRHFKRDSAGFKALVFCVACILFAYAAFHRSVGLPFNQWTRASCVVNGTVGSRNDIGNLLEKCKLKTGLELGVQTGGYSAALLEQWKSCTKYYLVESWAHHKQYKDSANVDDNQQAGRYKQAKQTLAKWENKTIFYRLTTVDAAPKFEADSLDFIYVDARHDYCAIKRDIELYWPKVRCGGVMAGHDYLWPTENQKGADNIWEMCENGETHEGGPKRAADEFVSKHNLILRVTGSDGGFPSWIITKD